MFTSTRWRARVSLCGFVEVTVEAQWKCREEDV
jgi:hypothetical protein